MFELGEYLFKFDLKSTMLIFGLNTTNTWGSIGTWMTFRIIISKVLPLPTACHWFTKLMKPLVRYWRGRGLKCIVYSDDRIVAIKGKDEAVTKNKKVR